ncbi:unnamed protein product, partial [Iphiclides podalirius]
MDLIAHPRSRLATSEPSAQQIYPSAASNAQAGRAPGLRHFAGNGRKGEASLGRSIATVWGEVHFIRSCPGAGAHCSRPESACASYDPVAGDRSYQTAPPILRERFVWCMHCYDPMKRRHKNPQTRDDIASPPTLINDFWMRRNIFYSRF